MCWAFLGEIGSLRSKHRCRKRSETTFWGILNVSRINICFPFISNEKFPVHSILGRPVAGAWLIGLERQLVSLRNTHNTHRFCKQSVPLPPFSLLFCLLCPVNVLFCHHNLQLNGNRSTDSINCTFLTDHYSYLTT